MNTASWTCVVAIVVGIFHLENGACVPLNATDLAQTEPEPERQPEDYRLEENVRPTHYDIEVKPYFTAEPNRTVFTFDGAATITISALQDGVTHIKLHQSQLNILSWSVLRRSNSQAVRQLNHTHDEETEILTLQLGEPLLRNVEYLLAFNYVGVIENNMCGFYRSYYNESGKQVWIGATQFEQTNARRAFPCFDEPKFKATFTLKINHNHLEHSVYSNTPIVSSVDLGNNRSLTTFEITPKMSSYLLAFIVAPYELSGQGDVRLLTRPEASNQTEYAVSEGLKLLHRLGEWIDYPFNSVREISRIYMAAVPDFASGAMENWGLVNYRESRLLYVPEDATSRHQQRIATIISHELGHQWFGNLVTCEWWDAIWLNEGFATYLEFFGAAMVEPGWELEQQFVVEKLQISMMMDSVPLTHPMTQPVYRQDQVAAMFDVISYNKGAAVLRMMERYLSSAVFKTVLREYVKEQAFEAARPEDLFSVLNRHSPNASAYMEPWTTQAGYPLVTVTTTEGGFTLTQKRFLINGTDHNDRTLWPLPVTFSTKPADFANTKPTFVATEAHTVPVPNASSVPYFILNNQQIGHYRVNYEARLWDKISQALRSDGYGGIHVINRAQIVDDLFNLAAADVVSYGTALDILEYLKGETEYLPWLAAASGLNSLFPRIHLDDGKLFAHHILDIFAKAYEHVQFQTPTSNERRVHTYLRQVVLDWTCWHGHDDCSKSAVKEFERFRSHPNVKVHPDLREVVYCEGVRRGSTEQFDFMIARYRATNVATERQLILEGLGCVSEKALIYKFISFIHSPDVRRQDKQTALSNLLNNQYTVASATAYLVEHIDALVELYNGPTYAVLTLHSILIRSKDPAVRETIRAFADAHKDQLGDEGYDIIVNGLSEFDSNQDFILNHREEIGAFLKQKAAGGTATTSLCSVTVTFSLALVALCRW